MSLLLDTCVIIWLLDEHEKIPKSLTSRLVSPDVPLFLSHVSYLELAIKYSRGKLPWSQPPSSIIPPLVEQMAIEVLPLDEPSIFHLEALPHHHRDPFDRLLIAQALANELTMVSPDDRFTLYPVSVLWGNPNSV